MDQRHACLTNSKELLYIYSIGFYNSISTLQYFRREEIEIYLKSLKLNYTQKIEDIRLYNQLHRNVYLNQMLFGIYRLSQEDFFFIKCQTNDQ